MFDIFAAQLLGNLHLAQKQHRELVNPKEKKHKNLAVHAAMPANLPEDGPASEPQDDGARRTEAYPVNPV